MAYAGFRQWMSFYDEACAARMSATEARLWADMSYAQERGHPFGDNVSGPPLNAPPPRLALPAPAPSAQAPVPVVPKLTTKPFPHARPRKTTHAHRP